METTRLMRCGADYAVFANGMQAGIVRRDGNAGRMWIAEGIDGRRRGIFPSKRTAAEWLASKEY